MIGPRGRSRRVVVVAALAAATLALPPLLPPEWQSLYVFIGLYAIVTCGLSLLMGFAGQVSLGQAAFYAIGAYAAAIPAVHGAPPALGLLAGPVVAAAVAAAIGVPLLRLRGHYLAFGMLAFQLILLTFIAEAGDLTGGDIGLRGIPPLGIGGVQAVTPLEYAYVTWLAVTAVFLITRNVVRSRPGRALRALATSESAAAAAGVPVATYKVEVFALSAAYAGLAGAIYAFFLSYIAPGSFPILLSIQFLVMAAVGGLGAVWGSLVGAAVVTLVVQLLQEIGSLPAMPTQVPAVLSYAVYALVLIVVMLLLPSGIVPALTARAARRRRDDVAPTEATVGDDPRASRLSSVL